MEDFTERLTTPDLGATAERIVVAARLCFERYGIPKTTIEDIAKAAGVSRPTVYKHFGGKEQIVDHISLAEMDKVQDAIRSRIRPSSDFAERLTEIILVSVQSSAENVYVRRFVEDFDSTVHSLEPSSPYQVLARERWHALLEKARAKDQLAADLDLDEVVAWLSLTQVMLLTTVGHVGGGHIGSDEARLRRFIRRYVVEPLLAARGR